jgi:hypothetical protein
MLSVRHASSHLNNMLLFDKFLRENIILSICSQHTRDIRDFFQRNYAHKCLWFWLSPDYISMGKGILYDGWKISIRLPQLKFSTRMTPVMYAGDMLTSRHARKGISERKKKRKREDRVFGNGLAMSFRCCIFNEFVPPGLAILILQYSFPKERIPVGLEPK